MTCCIVGMVQAKETYEEGKRPTVYALLHEFLHSWHSTGKRDLRRSKETYEEAKRPRAYDLLHNSHSTMALRKLFQHLFDASPDSDIPKNVPVT